MNGAATEARSKRLDGRQEIDAHLRRVLLVLIVVASGLFRFLTLGVQSYWVDEGYTVGLVQLPFGEMLNALSETERTPPLYYVVAWLWANVFGSHEVALRSLSALIGTGSVVLAYLVGREFVSPRAGLIAAALVAFNPLLFWFSQEARSYPLFILLGEASLLFFGRALRTPSPGVSAAWAASSALVLATHYFAIFLIAPQAVWLVWRYGRDRAVQVSTALVGVSALVLAPLALHQRNGNPIEESQPLVTRLIKIPKEWVAGFGSPGRNVFAVLAALLVLFGLLLLVRRASGHAQRGASLLGVIVALVVVPPIGLAIVGVDYLDPIYVVEALPAALIVVAAGFAVSRAGIVAAVLLVLVSVATIVVTESDATYQRTDWRSAVAEFGSGPTRGPRAIMVIGAGGRFSPVDFYARGSSRMLPTGASVKEVVLLGLATEVKQARLALPRQFSEVANRRVQQLVVRVFRSRDARPVTPTSLRSSYFGTFPRTRIGVHLQPSSSTEKNS